MGDDERASSSQSRESRRTPRGGVPAPPTPVEIFDENSDTYEGDELVAFRAQRPLGDRVGRLEVKHDALALSLTEVKGDVKGVVKSNAKMIGKLDAFMTIQAQQASQPQHAESLLRVVRETTTATLAERVLDEKRDTARFRRKFILSGMKLAGIIAGAGGTGVAIHWILQKIGVLP